MRELVIYGQPVVAIYSWQNITGDAYSSCGSSELPWFVFKLVCYLRGGMKTKQAASLQKGREFSFGVLYGSRNKVSLANYILFGCLCFFGILGACLKNKFPSRISHIFIKQVFSMAALTIRYIYGFITLTSVYITITLWERNRTSQSLWLWVNLDAEIVELA